MDVELNKTTHYKKKKSWQLMLNGKNKSGKKYQKKKVV